MSVDKITMLATPAIPEGNALPQSVAFDPSTPISEPSHAYVQFVVDQSLLNYINDDAYTVTFIWQGAAHTLTSGEGFQFDVGPSGSTDQFKLVVALSAPSITDVGETTTSTDGQIIVR